MIKLATIKTKIIVCLTALVVAGAIFWYQNWQINRLRNDIIILSQNNTKLEESVKTQKQTVSSLETGLSDAIKNSNNLAERLAKSDEQRQVVVEKLKSYRGRLANASLKKPKLIESRVNAATVSILHQFDQATDN